MAFVRIHSQQGIADMTDPTNTQSEPSTGLVPFSYSARGFDVVIVPINASGVAVTGTDRGQFDVKSWYRDSATTADGSVVVRYAEGVQATTRAYANVTELDLPPGVQYGVVVTSVVLPTDATGFLVNARVRS